jgi:hypothetical protein
MSQISSLNQDALDAFLRDIGYGSIIGSLPPERKIVVNWDSALAKLTDGDGVVWSRYKGGSNIGQGVHRFDVSAKYQAILRSSDKDVITLDIHSLGSERQALDYMLKQASLVTTLKIRDKLLRHPQCFADFCLEGRISADKEARFVHGNFYVEISGEGDNNTKSVVPVAKAVHQILLTGERSTAGRPGTAPVVRLSLSPTSVRVGEKISVEIDTTNYPEADWEAEIKTRDKKLEYVDGDYGKEEYEAKASGTETIKAILMNKKTLQFAEMEKQVLIDP